MYANHTLKQYILDITSCHHIGCLGWNSLLYKTFVPNTRVTIMQRFNSIASELILSGLVIFVEILTYFERYGHLLGDTGIITQPAVWATGIRHTRNRHLTAICYPPVCKGCFDFLNPIVAFHFNSYTSHVVKIWRMSVAYTRRHSPPKLLSGHFGMPSSRGTGADDQRCPLNKRKPPPFTSKVEIGHD